MNPNKKETPLELLHQAYKDSPNAVDFCNWYSLNRIALKDAERQLIIETYDAAIEDAEMDLERVFNGVEYWTIFYKKP